MAPKNKPLSTRIIAGKYRGKKILLPPASFTRSSKARLRDSFFNTLQNDIVGAYFIEMFGGSGSVGLEALSRGAKRVWFVEKEIQAFTILQHNVASLDPLACEVILGDAFEKTKAILQRWAKEKQRGYLYIDPPFSIREGYESIYEKVICFIADLAPETIQKICIEHMRRASLPECLGAFEKSKVRHFGKSTLSYYEPY